jgi:hypothetical protein
MSLPSEKEEDMRESARKLQWSVGRAGQQYVIGTPFLKRTPQGVRKKKHCLPTGTTVIGVLAVIMR